MQWVRKYIRIPFRELGRDLTGLDCWGLIWLVYREEQGIEINTYAGVPCDSPEVTDHMARDSALPPWQYTLSRGGEKPFDVAVMRSAIRGKNGKQIVGPFHVGLVYAPGKMIHIERGCNVVSVGLSDQRIARRILSIHRHEALA